MDIASVTSHTVDFKTQKLQARDVELKPFALDDMTDRYQAWLHDKETVKFLDVGLSDRTEAELKKWLQAVIADPNRLFHLIVLKENSQPVGTISLEIDPIHRVSHYGYLIGEKTFWGTPIALQAQVALFDFAFGPLGLRRIYGGARIGNVMSQFNFKRLGFEKEGVFRQHTRVSQNSEEYCDEVYYGLLAKEWAARSPKFDELRYSPGT